MGWVTRAQDYFHVIVCIPECVTHQIPNPVVPQCLGLKDPVASQTGSLCEGVTQTHASLIKWL